MNRNIPTLKGQWVRARVPGVTGQPGYDPTKAGACAAGAAQAGIPEGPRGQSPDQALGGQDGDPTYVCISPGMPRIMNPYGDMEIVITPDTTHILLEHIHDSRRIFTDGRDWPEDIEPTFQGYSIGTWIDTDGDGRYDTLEVETRNFKGRAPSTPPAFRSIPTTRPWSRNASTGTRAKPDNLTNEITTIDDALTHPWTVTKTYIRQKVERPEWFEEVPAPRATTTSALPARTISERRRPPDAGQEGPAAAGPALFQAAAEVTSPSPACGGGRGGGRRESERVGWVELLRNPSLSPQTPSHGGWREVMGFARAQPILPGGFARPSFGGYSPSLRPAKPSPDPLPRARCSDRGHGGQREDAVPSDTRSRSVAPGGAIAPSWHQGRPKKSFAWGCSSENLFPQENWSGTGYLRR